MEKTENKKPLFTLRRFVTALICFVAFLVVGIGAYYMTAGEFVTADIAVIYVALALVGALGAFFRLRWFAVLFYMGCILGWVSGGYISSLKGEFAPAAGTICTFFLIAVFTLLGVMFQWKAIKKKRAKRREQEHQAALRAEEERKQAELDAARAEREKAEAAMILTAAQAGAIPEPQAEEKPAEPAAPAETEPVPTPVAGGEGEPLPRG